MDDFQIRRRYKLIVFAAADGDLLLQLAVLLSESIVFFVQAGGL